MYWKNIYPPTRTASLALLFYLNFANYLMVRSPDLALLYSPSGSCVTMQHEISRDQCFCDHKRLFYLLGLNFGDWRKVRDKSLKIFCFYRVYAMGVHIFKQYYSVRTLSKTSKTDHFSLSFDYINICIDWLFQRVLKGADEKWLGKQNNILKFFYKICFDILMPSSVVMSFRWMNWMNWLRYLDAYRPDKAVKMKQGS